MSPKKPNKVTSIRTEFGSETKNFSNPAEETNCDSSETIDDLIKKALQELDEEQVLEDWNKKIFSRTFQPSPEYRAKRLELMKQICTDEQIELFLSKRQDTEVAAELSANEQPTKIVAIDTQKNKKKRFRFKALQMASAIAIMFTIISVRNNVDALKKPIAHFTEIAKPSYNQVDIVKETNNIADININKFSLSLTLEGYQQVDSVSLEHVSKLVTYQNGLGQEYTFQAFLDSDFDSILFDTDRTTVETVDFLYGDAYYRTSKGHSTFTWTYNNCLFTIHSKKLSKEDLLRLAESLIYQ